MAICPLNSCAFSLTNSSVAVPFLAFKCPTHILVASSSLPSFAPLSTSCEHLLDFPTYNVCWVYHQYSNEWWVCPIIEKWLDVLCEEVTDSTNWFLLLTLNTTRPPPCFTSKIKRLIRSHTVMLHSPDDDLTATLSLQYTVWLQNSTDFCLQQPR